MEPRRLDHEGEKIEDAWDELVYTEALLLHDEDARDLAVPTSKLVEKSEEVRRGQLNCWRAETQADVKVGAQNYLLDIQTRAFERALRRDLEDRGLSNVLERPEYKTYFSIPLGQVVEMALEGQIKFMEPWLAHLEKESSPALLAYVALFKAQFASGREALEGRVKAFAATRNHRLTDIATLFEDANKARKILAGTLTTRAAEKKLPDQWPARFFRKTKRPRKASPEQVRRDAIFAIVLARSLKLSDEQKQRVQTERDHALLDRWMNRATTATRSDDVFA